MSQDFATQYGDLTQASQSQSRSPSKSPPKPRKPEPFLSVQIPNSAGTSTVTCSLLHAEEEESMAIWLTDDSNVYHLDLTNELIAKRGRILRIPSNELIAAIRNSFATKAITTTKIGPRMDVALSGRGAPGAAVTTIKFELERRSLDPNVQRLLLQFATSHDRLQQEVRDLAYRAEAAAPDGATVSTRSFSAAQFKSRKPTKKAKFDPHMSVINPKSRKIKPPKGAVFDEDGEEDAE